MSFRDRFGRRISVPDPDMIRESGEIAKKMADQMLEERLRGIPIHQVIIDDSQNLTAAQVTDARFRSSEMLGQWSQDQESNEYRDYIEAARLSLQAAAIPPELMEELNRTAPNEEDEEDEIVARTATARTAASKRNISKAPKVDTHIYNWGFQSSKPRYMGRYITYEAQLYENGTTSCNCPGWVLKRSGQERGCKHTKLIADEAKELHKKFKKGEDLPTVAITEEQINRLKNSKAEAAGETTAIKFGRIVETD